MATATGTARPKITLYLDTVSPFAYEVYYLLRVCPFPFVLLYYHMAAHILTSQQHDTVFKGCDVKFVPIFLGGLMHKVGFSTGPMMCPQTGLDTPR